MGAGALVGRGAEFIPRLEEGDLVVQVNRPPSVSIEESVRGNTTIQQTLLPFPEVKRVVARTGSPDVATDIMGIEQSDVFVILKPRAEWPVPKTTEQLVTEMDHALRKALPGAAYGFTQPIDMRVQELLGGVKSDVGIKVFGDDLATLRPLVALVLHEVAQVRGASDVRSEALEGLSVVTVRPDPARMGRMGVRADELRNALELLRAGRNVGTLVEGERRFDVTLKADAPPLPDERAMAALPLLFGSGRSVPLGDVARVERGDAPAIIGRENGKRRVLVECNVRGRDLASFVGELSQHLDRVPHPPGYYFQITGSYENLVSATTRLAIVVPLTLAGIFVMLLLAFGDARAAALIFLNVPVAASGGLVALAARGLPLSISAAVGMIALFGVATLNRDPSSPRGGLAPGGGRALRCPRAPPSGAHHGDRGGAGLLAHGHGHGDGRRGATPPRHGGDGRPGNGHRAHVAALAAALHAVREEGSGPGLSRYFDQQPGRLFPLKL